MLQLKKFRLLEKDDFGILSAIELRMKHHEYVPLEEMIKFSGLRSDEVTFRIRSLRRDRLLTKSAGDQQGYQGYSLTTLGYDALALRALVLSGAVEAIGKSLGVGKEADVYDALSPGGKRRAIKFHRLGRMSFRQSHRKRGYIADRPHISWLYQSRLSAEKEYSSLETLYAAGVSVPKPIAHNRHVLVMGLIEGTELKFAELKGPKPILREILRNIKVAHQKAGLIHSDLSEYNILIKPNGKLLIIDWPQSVSTDHPNSQDYLKRDVLNILACFRRKAGPEPDLDNVLAYVTGKSRTLVL